MKKYYLCFVCFLFAFSISAQAEINEPKKVLFVGNSYTYFWNLPQQITALALDSKQPLYTTQSTAGGANLGQHWRSERNLKTQELLKNNTYEAIVLQDHSMRSIDHPDSLFLYAGRLAELSQRQKDTELYLYMTWAREWNPLMQTTITEKYAALAKELNAQVVPVGPAWERAKKLRPDIELYDEDGSHPSALGSYLSACVFYAVLTKQSPIGCASRLISKDQFGEKLYLNIVPPNDAAFLQSVAHEVAQHWMD